MHNMVFLFLAILLFGAAPAYADQSQAREVARLNNCIPKKIEVYDQKIAADIQTVYKIGCNMPKVVGKSSKQTATALLIRCNGSLCQMLRPVKD